MVKTHQRDFHSSLILRIILQFYILAQTKELFSGSQILITLDKSLK